MSTGDIPTTPMSLASLFQQPFSPLKPPTGYHPATPRLLLSLLATASYISVPEVASQVLSLISATVNPHTVVQYLNFANGDPIENSNENEPEAAVGLEALAELIPYSVTDIPSYIGKRYYGGLSDKIGEVAMCWLARWGPEILMQEKNVISKFGRDRKIQPIIWRREGLSTECVRGLVASDALFIKTERERYNFAKSIVDLRSDTVVDNESETIWREMFTTDIYYVHMVNEVPTKSILLT